MTVRFVRKRFDHKVLGECNLVDSLKASIKLNYYYYCCWCCCCCCCGCGRCVVEITEKTLECLELNENIDLLERSKRYKRCTWHVLPAKPFRSVGRFLCLFFALLRLNQFTAVCRRCLSLFNDIVSTFLLLVLHTFSAFLGPRELCSQHSTLLHYHNEKCVEF